MKNFKEEEIDVMSIMKTTLSYNNFYYACINEGLNDNQIDLFWNENKDYSGINC